MSSSRLMVLGAVAGLTIFLGLPLGRIRTPALRLKAFLGSTATGILLFLLWDVLSHAIEPVNNAVVETFVAHHPSTLPHLLGLAVTFVVGLVGGLLGLVHYEGWMNREVRRASIGPGAASVQEYERAALARRSPPERLAIMIAIGIGLHNFSEGLAIGQSAAKGEVSLALLLIIGFGLHNATEGFGIVGPLAGAGPRPTWGFLGLLGILGGGPTFLGTLVGRSFVSEGVFVAFLALAAGSIVYVVVELLHAGRKLGHKQLMAWGLVFGFLLGLATDLVLVAAGS